MSFAPDSDKLVNQLIQVEYKNACEKWGNKYNSLHEGYAVLLEEIEEAQNYFENVQLGLNNLWIAIKKNNENGVTDEQIEMLFDTKETIRELAQVGAVLHKIKNTLEVEE